MNSFVRVPVSPTFVSTDLITPGNRKRTTLPAIGYFTRPTRGTQPWGNETTETATKSLVYNSFKPSHLKNVQVCVTHRHYASRVSKYHPIKQPNEVTSLLLSTCRLNDQRLPCPFGSQKIETATQIAIPSPLRPQNAYSCHSCRFAVFPTSKPQRSNISHPTNDQSKSHLWKITKPTTTALMDIQNNLYNVTSYGQSYERKKHPHGNVKAVESQKDPQRTCQHCGKPRVAAGGMSEQAIDENPTDAVWPCWPPSGAMRMTNDQNPMLPSVSLYCKCILDAPAAVIQQDVPVLSIVPPPNASPSNPGILNQEPLLQKDRKTKAHLRFRLLFTDSVPDPRDMRKTGRKAIFGGYHTSIFRG